MTLIRFKPDSAAVPSVTSPVDLLGDFMNLQLPFFPANEAGANQWSPALDVHDDKDAFTVTLEAPGLRKEDFDISWHDGALTVSGERRETKSDNRTCFRRERFYGRFSRSVSLPADVQPDKIGASYRDGVLTVTLPKAEQAKPRQIEVNVN